MFEFNDMPLEQLVSQLSRWYDVDFFFANSKIRNFKFTGAIKRSNTLLFMLQFIEKTSNVYFKSEWKCNPDIREIKKTVRCSHHLSVPVQSKLNITNV